MKLLVFLAFVVGGCASNAMLRCTLRLLLRWARSKKPALLGGYSSALPPMRSSLHHGILNIAWGSAEAAFV
eukprot:12479658-Prorocentrum_lima.AAC.1